MLIIKLDETQAIVIGMALQEAHYEALVAFDPIDNAFKVKIDNGRWSPPMGIIVESPREGIPPIDTAKCPVTKAQHDWNLSTGKCNECGIPRAQWLSRMNKQ